MRQKAATISMQLWCMQTLVVTICSVSSSGTGSVPAKFRLFAMKHSSVLPNCFCCDSWENTFSDNQHFLRQQFLFVLLIQQQNECRRKTRFFYFFQMSKSTGNFLTLAQTVDKFSADGKYVLTCFCFSILVILASLMFCSGRIYWSI